MRYIGIERQLIDIFTKPFDSSRFADLWGRGLVFAILMAWFDEEFVLYLVYCIFYFSLAFLSYSHK
jgi:hypothetical protein